MTAPIGAAWAATIWTCPAPIPGTRQYIEFQGANHVATVYCKRPVRSAPNRGGFSTFRYDLTEAMTEKENILTVEVTNAPSDVYPQMADFTFLRRSVPAGAAHPGARRPL